MANERFSVSGLAARNSPHSPRAPWTLLALAGLTAIVAGGLGPSRPLWAIGVILFFWGSYVVVCAPNVGVVVLALLAPVLSGMRPGLPIPGFRLSEVIIVWLGGLIIFAARRPVPRWGGLEWAGLAYLTATLLLGLIDLARRHVTPSGSELGVLVGPLQYVLLLRAVRVGCKTSDDVRWTVRALLVGAVPVSLLALFQGFGVKSAHRLAVSITGVDEGHLNRAVGPFSNWQVLAGYLLVVTLLTSASLIERESEVVPVRLGAPLLVLLFAGLARTLTIGAFAGAIVGCGVLWIGSGRMHLTRAHALLTSLLAIAGLAVVIAARFKQQFKVQLGQASSGLLPQTIDDRLHNWTQQYLPALARRWTIGYGPGLPPQATWRYTDSVYITILLRGGLVLLGFYLLLQFSFYSRARQALRVEALRVPASTLVVAVALLLTLQFIATYFTTSGLPEVMWILAGLTHTLSRGGTDVPELLATTSPRAQRLQEVVQTAHRPCPTSAQRW